MMSRKRLEIIRDENNSIAIQWADPISHRQALQATITALKLLDEIEILAQENMILQEAVQNDRPVIISAEKISRCQGNLRSP